MAHTLDLSELSSRAEGYRGFTVRQVGSVLVARARNAGIIDAESFRRGYDHNAAFFSNLRVEPCTEPIWNFRLGLRRDYFAEDQAIHALKLRERLGAEFLTLGILAQLEGLEVAHVVDGGQSVQVASGLHRGTEVSVLFREDRVDGAVSGFGYNRFVHPVYING